MTQNKICCGWCGKVIQEKAYEAVEKTFEKTPAIRVTSICKECMGKFIETLKEPPHDKGGDR